MIEELKRTPVDRQRVEIVERKGLGHPDYICDAIMNQVSVELSKEYMRRFGAIMHHNIDKSLLAAGEIETRFGGGVVKKPMLLVFGDRATFEVGDETVPVEEIAVETAKGWFRENLRFVDPEECVRYQVEVKRGAAALRDIFERKGRVLGANDTSAAVGYAPMTETEMVVFETERFLNSKSFKGEFPESGEDIKVMGLRKKDVLQLTVAMAFVDRYVDSEHTYFRRKGEITQSIEEFLTSRASFENTAVHVNTLDTRGRGVNGVYLTVLGTSADGADCGQVGRGNRVNGVIPLNRPVSSEAAAGKNPVSHVGKIYNVLSYHIANKIFDKVSGIREVYVWLLSQIGSPIDQPHVCAVQVVLEPGGELASISNDVEEVACSEFDNVDKFCMDLAYGKIPVC